MALFDTIRAGASGATGDYEVERSLRFNDDDSPGLSRTPSSTGNQRTFTVSAWVKRTKFDSGHTIFSAGPSGSNLFAIYFPSEQFSITEIDGGSQHLEKNSSARFRDPAAWYHVLVGIDTTQSTAEDRFIAYINGERLTEYDFNNIVSQNTDLIVNTQVAHYVGRMSTGNHFDGYIAEFNFIDGQQLTPSSFAATDSLTGQYNPIKYTGSYGTNGFYLNFSDNSGTSATTLGKDYSGNGHNFTPANFNVTANSVENDSVLDTPTNNWCVLNPLTGYWSEGGSIPFADGNLHVDNPNSGDRAGFATFRLEDGKKYYIEGVYLKPGGSGSQCKWAITTLSKSDGVAVKPGGSGSFGFDWRGGGGTPQILNSGSSSTIGSQPSNGEVIGMAIDLANGKIYVHKSNSYYNSGDPDNGTGAIITGISTGQDYQFITSVDSGGPNFSETKINFGQQGFAHQPTSFTDLLNSQNLPDPTIPLPTQHFEAVTYTGNSGTQSITGLSFAPDWVWIKERNDSGSHAAFDIVRGVQIRLKPDNSNAEITQSDTLTSFNSDGFTLGGNGHTNDGNTFVAWSWNAGSSTVTNTDGDITSQVRANPTAGFSIVSYTGNGGSNQTIGHGLGVTPQAYITKNRDSNGANWEAQWNVAVNKSVAFRGSLNLTEQNQNNSLASFTSTTFSVASSSTARNANNKKYIAYVFSSVKGYSLVGSYVGNSNSNGAFIFCGFRPAWVMVKRSTGSDSWLIMDNKRSTFNPVGNTLAANSSGSENADTGGIPMDFVANGFKCRGTGADFNENGQTYIFLAFAESPFKYARAR
tara:strand:- start:398 stop:2821 length:2424 start_codon:yes stop_codon:yes gene_type:complete